MSTDISKVCSDFLRQSYAPAKLKASHAREIVAAFFGYKSHASLLAERHWPLSKIGGVELLVPDVSLIEKRLPQLDDLAKSELSPSQTAELLSEFLQRQRLFPGEVWICDNLETYVIEEYLYEKGLDVENELAGVMAETNAYFDEAYYNSATTTEQDGVVVVEAKGQYSGTPLEDKAFCGDQIDMIVKVTFARVAGRVGFSAPELSATGAVNLDWLDPDVRSGSLSE